ncbi:MAG: quinone-dependent dihydroorotate dehydrogenase [Myxococcota bacterium]
MYPLIKPLLFRMDPERAHERTVAALQRVGHSAAALAAMRAMYVVEDPRLRVSVAGLEMRNPVGLAAGYDKNGVAVPALAALGFGHVEVGTVTRVGQPGNPRPRVHRIPEARAVINAMGFPNGGADVMHVQKVPGVPVGINVGKNKDTPLEHAAEEYSGLLQKVHPQADYLVVNVSSPNTPGLRQLQTRAFVEGLVQSVTTAVKSLTPKKPLFIKISPDMEDADLDHLLETLLAHGVDGVIATNTTLSRAGVTGFDDVAGGLSGAPLRARSTAVIRRVYERTQGRLPIIGVGGIASAEDALEKLRAGASVVQVYTGLVYEGPGLVRRILEGLIRACEREAVADLPALVARIRSAPQAPSG